MFKQRTNIYKVVVVKVLQLPKSFNTNELIVKKIPSSNPS